MDSNFRFRARGAINLGERTNCSATTSNNRSAARSVRVAARVSRCLIDDVSGITERKERVGHVPQGWQGGTVLRRAPCKTDVCGPSGAAYELNLANKLSKSTDNKVINKVIHMKR